MATDTIPVLKIEEAEQTAFEMGRDRFEGAEIEDPEDFDLSGFQQYAEYANHTLPALRALAGYADGGHGTYQIGRTVAVIEPHQADDVPAEAEAVESHHIYNELVDKWTDGAYSAIDGE